MVGMVPRQFSPNGCSWLRQFWQFRHCHSRLSGCKNLIRPEVGCSQGPRFLTYDQSHIEVLKRTFRYIAGTSHIGIDYNGNGPFQEVCYTDSDYAQQHERKSIGGGIMML